MLKHIQHYSIWKYRDTTFDPLGLRTKSQTNLTNGCEFILWEARLQKERTLKSKLWMLKCKRWIWLPHMRMPNSLHTWGMWVFGVCTVERFASYWFFHHISALNAQISSTRSLRFCLQLMRQMTSLSGIFCLFIINKMSKTFWKKRHICL